MGVRRLNQEEIKALPFEMQVCYMLQGWNNNFLPKTPEEWAEGVGFYNYKGQGVSNKELKAINNAIADAKYHMDFIQRFIL